MPFFEWDEEKNQKLKDDRGVSFEEAIIAITTSLIKVIKNPSSNFPKQEVYVITINEYVYYIPFVKRDEIIFLKTIIPSRKATKKYLHKK